MTKEAFYSLFLKELRDLYNVENQIIDALPDMISVTTSPDLKEAFEIHLSETQNQVTRLKSIFKKLNERESGGNCIAMKGILEDGKKIIELDCPDTVKDAALICAAQCVEHYEIARYGSARTWAKELGFDDFANLLGETLDEEANADKKLTDLAEGGIFTTGINRKARQ